MQIGLIIKDFIEVRKLIDQRPWELFAFEDKHIKKFYNLSPFVVYQDDPSVKGSANKNHF